MFRRVGVSWLLAAIATTVLAAALEGNCAQAPANRSIPNETSAPAASLPDAAQANSAAQSSVANPAAQPTPEELGDSLSGRQRYQAAIAAYAKDPHPSAALWNKMGIAYQMMFNLKDATRCYKASLKLDSHNPQVLNNLGTVYDSMKDYKAAEKMYHKALKLDPNSAIVLKNLGTNLLAQHDYSRGWEAYQKALAIDPEIFQDRNSPRVENPASIQQRGAMNYYMALGCLRIGNTDCAIQYLRMALDEGFTTAKKVASDNDFASLRGNPAFKELLAEQKQPPRSQ